MIPKKIIDNSDITLAQFLNEVLKEIPDTQFDIATAFFNIKAFALVKDNLQSLKRFRLLIGKTPEIQSNQTLGEALLNALQEEIEGFPLLKDYDNLTKELISFLKKDNVEVRLYDKEFLHGKAYIFDSIVVIGSSNFTPSGLTYNTELNAVALESEAEYVRNRWFEKFWNEARDFKAELIELLESSRFGTKEYTPYEVFIKTLFEFQKEDFLIDEKLIEDFKPESRVDLAEFQEDAVRRVMSRLKKYRACLVADSVGLGKTWIAKKVIEEFGFYRRKKFLIVCPAQLRAMWAKEIKDLILSESILSQEELAGKDFLEKAKRAVGGNLEEVSLIVVDESHNFRNPLSHRWENLYTLISDHIAKGQNGRPYMLFMTATPINNTIWDLYWQLMHMTLMDTKTFFKEGIKDLTEFFKEIHKQEDPSLLNDILNEISIRRTRDYIKKNYPDAEIDGKKIIFPERELENVEYQLDKAYQGFYQWIADTITKGLTMAYYRLLNYKKAEKLTQAEEMALGRMIALEGIFRTILLKRLESSVEAFRKSVSKHIDFLEHFKKNLQNGILLTKQSFDKYLSNLDEESEEEIELELEPFNKDEYQMEKLFEDIDKDIEIFKEIYNKIADITPEKDAKLQKLKEILSKLSEKGQIVLFTYYADTLDYLYESICKNDKCFSNLKIEKISGRTPSAQRQAIVEKFMKGQIDILMSTDVLSEGMNLQSAQFLINYDLHWNPTRMIQRAGRIDRIGCPFEKIYVYNFFPEEELEDLIRLVEILQNKIRAIDSSIGLDASVLGEEINPKVFGVIRRIKEKDTKVFDELETEMFGGGEKFYQPLMDFLRTKSIEHLQRIPCGIYSGLKRGIKAIFFYYKYDEDFHFWYLYDIVSGAIEKRKTKILEYISCPPDEARVIPDFFEFVFEINKKIVEDIEYTYKELEQQQNVDPLLRYVSAESSKKFILKMIKEIDIRLDEYLLDFKEDKEWEERWNAIRDKLLEINLTKKRTKQLRAIWRAYTQAHKSWKKLIKELEDFLSDKTPINSETIEPFDMNKLKLITVDFIS